jgi:hypothetical protein
LAVSDGSRHWSWRSGTARAMWRRLDTSSVHSVRTGEHFPWGHQGMRALQCSTVTWNAIFSARRWCAGCKIYVSSSKLQALSTDSHTCSSDESWVTLDVFFISTYT